MISKHEAEITKVIIDSLNTTDHSIMAVNGALYRARDVVDSYIEVLEQLEPILIAARLKYDLYLNKLDETFNTNRMPSFDELTLVQQIECLTI